MTYREALTQYKDAYKVLHGAELTSVNMKAELFTEFLKEIMAPVNGVMVVCTTFEVDGVSILKT